MNFFQSIRFITALAASVGLAAVVSADQQPEHESAASAGEAQKLDLNTAPFDELAAVPVIGEDGARAIIAARPFTRIDDLDRLRGISAERLEQIRAKVTVATIHIPKKLGMPKVETRQAETDEDRRPRVNLNTADLEALAAVPSIGPRTARDIIAERPFTTVDELSRLPGISAERLELIRTRVTVVPVEAPKERRAGRTAKPESRRQTP